MNEAYQVRTQKEPKVPPPPSIPPCSLTPRTRPNVKAPQKLELASAALVSDNPISLEEKVKSQLPMAVSAAVVQKTSVTTAQVQRTSRACRRGRRGERQRDLGGACVGGGE